MPHLQLEYSANVPLEPQLGAVLEALNQALAAIEVAPLADIKSRAVKHTQYCVGDGAPEHAFIHLQVRLLSGRDASVLGRLSQTCMRVLTDMLTPNIAGSPCQVSVEVLEMDRSTYLKQRELAP